MRKFFVALTVCLLCPVNQAAAEEVEEMARQITLQINSNEDLHPGGSGFVVGKRGDTYTVLTANHVVCIEPLRPSPQYQPGQECRQDANFTVRTSEGGEYPVTLEYNYQQSHGVDLALVSFSAPESLAIATLGDANVIESSSTVYPSGFPTQETQQGRSFESNEGFVVSNLKSARDGYSIQYAAETHLGMSGGPVLDIDGRVIGVHGGGANTPETRNSTVLGTSLDGFKAAIPINEFEKLCAEVNNCPQMNFDRSEPSEDVEARLRNPESARDFYAKGLQMHAQHQYSTAETLYSEAIRLNNSYGDAYRHRGLVRVKQRQYQEAINDWTRALESGYVTAQTYHHRGLAYYRLKNLAQAEANYRLSLELNPYYSSAHRSMGDLYFDVEQYDNAIWAYSEAIKVNSNDAEAYFNRATASNNLGLQLQQHGDNQGAIQAFRTALQDLELAMPLLLDSGNQTAYQEARVAYRQTEKNVRLITKKQL